MIGGAAAIRSAASRRVGRVASLFALAASVLVSSASHGEAQGAPIRILRDPTPYTNVADAADDDDPFDLNLTVGYGWSRYRAELERETPSASGATAYAAVGRYERVRQTFDLNLEIGIFKDFAAYAYLPVVLSDAQSIGTSSVSPNPANDVSADPSAGFSGFQSPTRSGLDTLTTGLAWAPLNQNRTPEAPTLVLMFDTTTPIGKPMHPCNAADLNASPCAGSPGMTRGTQGIHFETRLSRRYRFVEPYFGLGARAEVPTRLKGSIRPIDSLPGYQRTFPPIVGQFTFGAAFVPYEHLRRFQRLVIDLRVLTEYVSSGRDFTPMYDMLGSSPALRNTVVCESGDEPPGGACTGTQGNGVPFTGVTDIDAYGRVGGRVTLDFQAARYFRINFATNLLYVTAHYMSTAAACNAGEDPKNHPTFAGTCTSGIVNPEYRATIDEPGQRFHIRGGLQMDFVATAVAQF